MLDHESTDLEGAAYLAAEEGDDDRAYERADALGEPLTEAFYPAWDGDLSQILPLPDYTNDDIPF